MPQDDGEAVKWYYMAAEQGVAAAQTTVGEMYLKWQWRDAGLLDVDAWRRMSAQGQKRLFELAQT